jgi:hypothetical protein
VLFVNCKKCTANERREGDDDDEDTIDERRISRRVP